MVELNNQLYRSLVLKVLKYSNDIAMFMILLAVYVCFSPNLWLYVTILGISSVYLGWLTTQFISAEASQCQWQMRSLQYDCQIASFNSRLSILSNFTTAVLGSAFTILMIDHIIRDHGAFEDDLSKISVSYMVGFFKMLMMFLVVDKIHTSQIIISILFKYSQSMRHLTLEPDEDVPEKMYPIIFLDGAPISKTRYEVTFGGDKIIGVTFTPSLSLGNDSIIEYLFVKEDADHKIKGVAICDESDRITCLFKCRAIVRKLRHIPANLNEL